MSVLQEQQGTDGAGGYRSGELPLWDVRDVARYLKKSISWVYHAAAADEVPCHRIGGSLRFAPEEIHAFARGESGSGSTIGRVPRSTK